jgi:hypothetical protein
VERQRAILYHSVRHLWRPHSFDPAIRGPRVGYRPSSWPVASTSTAPHVRAAGGWGRADPAAGPHLPHLRRLAVGADHAGYGAVRRDLRRTAALSPSPAGLKRWPPRPQRPAGDRWPRRRRGCARNSASCDGAYRVRWPAGSSTITSVTTGRELGRWPMTSPPARQDLGQLRPASPDHGTRRLGVELMVQAQG